MDFLDLRAVKTARGRVSLPGSKSISNRVLLLAALADGATQIRDLLVSDDTARMLDALQALGVPIIDTIYRAGYYDQPHLTRSLKYFIGQTPAQLLDRSRAQPLSLL